jgi:hypothetical protein
MTEPAAIEQYITPHSLHVVRIGFTGFVDNKKDEHNK